MGAFGDELRDRARGCLLGLAVGDALGGPLEFLSAEEIVERHGGPVRNLVGGGWLGLRPGQVTDDTQMALCLARSLVERGGYERDDALRRYVDWYRSGPLDVGQGTSAVLSAVVAGQAPDKAALAFHERTGGRSAGNGSLMRIAPLALRYRDDPGSLMNAAREDSALTHHDPLAAEACAAFCVLVAAKLSDHEALELPLRSDALVEAASATPEDAAARARTQVGFVATALAVALCAYRSFDSFEDGLVWAANLGGDADTNGAVTGALLGARHGAGAIPARWLEALEPRAELVARADALIEPRPRAGRPERQAEPSSEAPKREPRTVARLPGDSYRVLPGLLAGPYPGGADRSQAERKLEAFLELGVSCFIDLTEEGEGPPLQPYSRLLAEVAKRQRRSATHLRFGVVDLNVPAEWQLRAILNTIRLALEAGGGVYLHCWGGVGRTGTVIGCLLVENGMSAADAIAYLKTLRSETERASRSSPETEEQRAYIERWARDRRGAAIPRPDADWNEITVWAHLFDGYEHFGDAWGERLTEARERWQQTGELPDDPQDLHALLFLEFRSDRFSYGDDVMPVETEPGVLEIVPNPDYESTPSARYRRAIVARLKELAA